MERSSEIHEALARDLTETFFKLLRQYPEKKTDDVIKMVPLQKAPRFYVSFETTRRRLSRIKKGEPVFKINTNKIKLYAEIYKRWKALNNGTDFNNNSYACLHDIINSPASCFYIDFQTARAIIYKYLRKK